MLRFNSTLECEIAHKNATSETTVDYEVINSDEIYGPIYEAEPGHSEKMGVNIEGSGCNVAIWAGTAEIVDVCIFDEEDHNQTLERWRLTKDTENKNGVFCGFVPGMKVGDIYGLRVHGEWNPTHQKMYDYSKLLVDPYAKAITGAFDISANEYLKNNLDNLSARRGVDSSSCVPRCVVVDESYDWGNDKRPDIPRGEAIIYEGHVKDMTYLHPDVPENKRGTYAGVASKPFINHLKTLGITTLELMPVQHFVSEPFLQSQEKKNHWGYNTLGFFAPHAEYSSSGKQGEQVTEFKDMIKSLHDAGIEVILDVEYNHTPEGSEGGPTLIFKGLGEHDFYHFSEDGKHCNYSGCGNTLNASSDAGLNFIISSLRYWAEEMHIDGLRFDLATILAREANGSIDMNGRFMTAIQNDPILSKLKLIVEPWDGGGGYKLGEFSNIWQEWNGKFRDAVRDYWLGNGTPGSLASSLAGGFIPAYKSINFTNCHDGFTMNDVVSYNKKQNIDGGTDDNRSFNFGCEGPTNNSEIKDLRARAMRNMALTAVVSAGTPMFSHGDEIMRTQNGDNNTYCQDNEISWMHYDQSEEKRNFFKFVAGVIHFRKKNHLFAKISEFTNYRGAKPETNTAWLKSDGYEFEYNDMAWKDKKAVLGMFLSDLALNNHLLYYANGSNMLFSVKIGLVLKLFMKIIYSNFLAQRFQCVKVCLIKK